MGASLSDIPNGPHWAIIEISTIYIPGDERSRTNPGHGYPASDERVVLYRAFTVKSEWESEVEMLTMQGKSFRAVSVNVAKVSVKVEVSPHFE